MLLYNSAISGNCYKVRLLLAHLGIEYERHELDVVDRSNRPEVLGGLNPALRVPTLVLDDGRVLAESNAIIDFFAEGTEYMPDDGFERAQVLQWQFFEQYSHEPYIAVARFLRKHHPDPESQRAVADSKMSGGYRALEVMEGHLADTPFFVGGRFTIADIALYAYTHAAGDGGFELERFPAVRAWLDRVQAQPGCTPMPG